jgi:ubiquinone/menaquinone biosynthesis C-methylase UbiE
MKPEYEPILKTFEMLASVYARRQGMEEVNRRVLAPVVREWRGRILDVGAGAGALIEKYLDPSRHEVVTIDFASNMLAETRARLGGEVGSSVFLVRALAQALPFACDSFDAALAVNTLHNMPDWPDIRQAFVEMARVVRPGGIILAEFRNWNNPQRRAISRLHDTSDLPQKSFTFEKIEQALGEIGFEVERRIPIWGEHPSAGPFMETYERMKAAFGKPPADMAPRFAVVARKGSGFRAALRNALGYPVVE